MFLPTTYNIFDWRLLNYSDKFQESSNSTDYANNNATYKSKRFLKTFSPYKLNSDDLAELAPLLPFIVILTILFILLLIIGFRRWPGLVAGIVAGCLTSASLYLIMSAIAGDIPLYE